MKHFPRNIFWRPARNFDNASWTDILRFVKSLTLNIVKKVDNNHHNLHSHNINFQAYSSDLKENLRVQITRPKHSNSTTLLYVEAKYIYYIYTTYILHICPPREVLAIYNDSPSCHFIFAFNSCKGSLTFSSPFPKSKDVDALTCWHHTHNMASGNGNVLHMFLLLCLLRQWYEKGKIWQDDKLSR